MAKTYEEKVIYQIYPSSFYDANNDGWGDLEGIIEKLDYIKSLGVGIIWLSPIYKSPMVDMGYDISDYKAINPKFGTMEDFDRLMVETKKRGLKVVMDLVINHTSNEHTWFKKAINSPTTKYRNYYYFSSGRGRNYKKTPNNWSSVFAGSAWEKVPNDDKNYYLHLYSKEQPDLNYHSEELIKEIESILKFWFDKGVYGFRCDVINSLWKSSLKNGRFRLSQVGREFYEDQDGLHDLLKRFRTEVLDNYDCFLVGENASANPLEANKYIDNGELEMLITFKHQYADKLFGFPLINAKFNAKTFLNNIFDFQNNCHYNCNYIENHDQKRIVSRIDPKLENRSLVSKAMGTLMLTLKGTPIIYQGQELGMSNLIYNKLKEVKESKDCVTYSVYNTLKSFHISDKLANKLALNVSRDDERTPMQWNDHVNAGFNKGYRPWMRVNNNYLDGINVEAEEKNDDSELNYYRKLIAYRNKSNILKFGSIKRIESDKNLAMFIREYENERLLIVVNLTNKTIKIKDNIDRNLVMSNYNKDFKHAKVPPYFAGIYIIA